MKIESSSRAHRDNLFIYCLINLAICAQSRLIWCVYDSQMFAQFCLSSAGNKFPILITLYIIRNVSINC